VGGLFLLLAFLVVLFTIKSTLKEEADIVGDDALNTSLN
jgi:hypothetical protein